MAVFGSLVFAPKTVFAAETCDPPNEICSLVCGLNEDLGDKDCPAPQTCCKADAAVLAVPEAAQPKPESPAPTTPTIEGGLVLPACVNDGSCSVDDIVQTGVNFANFLLGLSGALFFLIFIYGGAMYLLSFGDQGRVKKGQDAIKGAAIGIIFVMGAWTIVRYIYSSVTGPEGAGKKTTTSVQTPAEAPAETKKKDCAKDFPGYTCKAFGSSNDAQAALSLCQKDYDCKPSYCPGLNNIICAKKK
jgi:hypothetical protein